MADIKEAERILRDIGLPEAQQRDIACLTLLALAHLRLSDTWNKTDPQPIRIHDMIEFIGKEYGRKYAENSRETFRRQVLHQFIQGGLVIMNPDDPTRPTNSPNTCYQLTPEAVAVLKAFMTKNYTQRCAEFKKRRGSLVERYSEARASHRVPVRLPNGTEFTFSPGKHNRLQAVVITDFAARFVPGADVLYAGDTENKMLHVATDVLDELGIPVAKHNKLPDILFFARSKNLLVLVEVVTSHGPVTPKRQMELEDVLRNCELQRIYVTAFPDFKEFKKHLSDIAWGTEVWIHETPDHIIHFNGPTLFRELG
ncbi:MAG: restriction endonuclease [Candidatus Thorarchaeota archaeon]|nr:restriction endonuclease [Candidatus Thorarchaeota archaeon]